MTFKPGKSGNPDGRPAGTANALTRAARARIAELCDPLAFMASVMNGEAQVFGEGEDRTELIPTLDQRLAAGRTLIGKLTPDAKDNPLTFKVGEINGPADALACMGRVIASMGEGEITPTEATSVMGVVGLYVKAWEANDMEQRIAALEAKA